MSIRRALELLNATEWVLYGEPTNEEEFNTMFKKVIDTDENDTAILSDNPEDFGVTWKDIENKLEEIENNAPMEELRIQRNALLAETDWTALNDVTMSDEMKKYRQDLRDITKTAKVSLDNGKLKGVEWPKKPKD